MRIFILPPRSHPHTLLPILSIELLEGKVIANLEPFEI